jgi:lysophospholipase L1-like esterase
MSDENRAKAETRAQWWRRQLGFCLVSVLLALPMTELGFRIVLAAKIGPSLLFYGIPGTQREVHDAVSGMRSIRPLKRPEESSNVQTAFFPGDKRGRYFKYGPHQVRYTVDTATREQIPIGINSRGFRGPEFEDRKAPGVIRIVTLGASSTLGIGDRDDETYPYYLGQLLNRECADHEFEVINLGIPHLHSHENLALLRAEALRLRPDVVTFYEGFNDTNLRMEVDSARLRDRYEASRIPFSSVVLPFLRASLLTVAFLDYRYAPDETDVTPELLERHIQSISDHFLSNLSAILEECRRQGIVFIVADQVAVPHPTRNTSVRGVTMEQQARKLRRKLARGGTISSRWVMYFVTHVEVMKRLEDWAKANDVPFADVIGVLGHRRHLLLSSVHLSPRGNQVIAHVLGRKVLEQVCPGRSVPAGG